MVTKNFSFCLVLLTTLALLGCDTFPLKTRGEQPSVKDQPSNGGDQPVIIPDVQVEAPEFLQKEAPKLGLIIGGGGALSYAGIGFLQELEKNKIPVHAIAGVEWGALVAGAYALEGKAHSIEWKLLKLPKQNFSTKGFFSSGQGGVKISKFNEFLSEVYGNSNFSDLEIPFTCSFANVAKAKTGIRRSGRIRHAVRSCWPAEPHFQIEIVGANPLGISEMASFLRAQGATLVVYLDLESRNETIAKKQRMKNPGVALKWVSQKSIVKLLAPPAVDEVISLSVSGHQMNSYSSLRSIIRNGQLKSKNLVKGMAKKYAF